MTVKIFAFNPSPKRKEGETNPELWERIKREAEAKGEDPYEKLKQFVKTDPNQFRMSKGLFHK